MQDGAEARLHRLQIHATGLLPLGYRMRPNSVVTSRVVSVWIASAVFSLRCERILDRPQRADLFADLNDLCTEFLKPMKFRHLLLGLAQRRRRRKCLAGTGFRDSGLSCRPPTVHGPDHATLET